LLYTISPDGVIPAGPDAAGGWSGSGPAQAGLPAGMIAVRAADVARPGGAAAPGALVAPAGRVTPGEMLVF
jgi:hypothetical protein